METLLFQCLFVIMLHVPLTHFWPMFPFYTPLKAPENQRFAGVFRGYKMGRLVRNGLNLHLMFFLGTNLKHLYQNSNKVKTMSTSKLPSSRMLFQKLSILFDQLNCLKTNRFVSICVYVLVEVTLLFLLIKIV